MARAAGIKTIGIIGAGQMGAGIAQVAALAGYDVILNDISEERAQAGHDNIAAQLKKAQSKGKLEEKDAHGALHRITPSADIAYMAKADLVIEAATEDEALKVKILKNLCAHLKKSALLASNTSSISITRLAATTDRPEKFIGMHFMNPVPVMKLVEVISGAATSCHTKNTIDAVAQSMGKTVASAQDYPGFIANRILLPMLNEAIFACQEGVGDIQSIDTAMKLGANHPMGPLELADFIGLDTCLAIMRVLHEGLGDAKYRPAPLLIKYVDAGWLGRKTGRGFYDYSSGSAVPVDIS